ncbi:MAG: hypothetical protein QNJ65_20370 [Xenococcaceae cyanobacterium MO_234.B1]|nr:hypothetical protein [Xenococcaceae cyanobacterium MO_234.B1]
MSNSLASKHLIQTPDYHLSTSGCLRNLFPQFKRHVITAGSISGCVSGIAPVLELGYRVFVDSIIIQQLKLLSCKDFSLLLVFFVNIIGGSAFLSR